MLFSTIKFTVSGDRKITHIAKESVPRDAKHENILSRANAAPIRQFYLHLSAKKREREREREREGGKYLDALVRYVTYGDRTYIVKNSAVLVLQEAECEYKL